MCWQTGPVLLLKFKGFSHFPKCSKCRHSARENLLGYLEVGKRVWAKVTNCTESTPERLKQQTLPSCYTARPASWLCSPCTLVWPYPEAPTSSQCPAVALRFIIRPVQRLNKPQSQACICYRGLNLWQGSWRPNTRGSAPRAHQMSGLNSKNVLNPVGPPSIS